MLYGGFNHCLDLLRMAFFIISNKFLRFNDYMAFMLMTLISIEVMVGFDVIGQRVVTWYILKRRGIDGVLCHL